MAATSPRAVLHLIYVHGFYGDSTSFQSFPTDLQHHLSPKVPERFELRSSLYPTYKSVKPLHFATHNFLEWLTTQPPGPVIILGHSMGGLLAADAATHPSNRKHAGWMRIVGLIAFDSPFIGMHPHVVISGLASLLHKDQKKDERDKNIDKQMNDERHVNIVDDQVTDDWEAYKKEALAQERPSCHRPALALMSSSISIHSENSSSSSRSSSTIAKAKEYLSAHSDDPIVRWATKHRHDPLGAASRWIYERLQFGTAVADPSGLKERYGRLVKWDGQWINYRTETMPRGNDNSPITQEMHAQMVEDNNDALRETGIARSSSSSSASSQSSAVSTPSSSRLSLPVLGDSESEKEAKVKRKELRAQLKQLEREQKMKEKMKKRSPKKTPRHFIVLPTGIGTKLGGFSHWEKVVVAGVDDEVMAHIGIFIRGKNLGYDGLVEKVGLRILGWCERF